MKKVLGILVCIALTGCNFGGKSANHGGDGTGNGGDGVVAEFRQYAEMAIAIARNNNESIRLVPEDLFDGLLTDVTIGATDEILIGPESLEKDALNYPEQRLVMVHRGRWLSLESDWYKMVLALHELLSLSTKIDDSDYLVSSALLNVDPNSEGEILPKVDILFVIDDSGSMAFHQNALRSHIDFLVERIRIRRIDYHIGVTTTTAYNPLQPSGQRQYGDDRGGGRLMGNPSYITIATRQGLEKLKDNIIVGTSGSSTERPFDAILKSFTVSMNEPGNQGFYRDDADLEIVIFSDSWLSESSATFGPPPEVDPVELAAELIHFKGDRSIFVSSFVIFPHRKSEGCRPDGSERDFAKYSALHDIFRGAFYDLCGINYSEELKRLGEEIALRAHN